MGGRAFYRSAKECVMHNGVESNAGSAGLPSTTVSDSTGDPGDDPILAEALGLGRMLAAEPGVLLTRERVWSRLRGLRESWMARLRWVKLWLG